MARKEESLVPSTSFLFLVLLVLTFTSSITKIESRGVSTISVANDEYYGSGSGSGSGSGTVPSEWLEEYYEGNLLYSTTMPQDPTLLASVGNGYISTVIFSPSQFLAGIFNGPQISQTAPSHRAAIPSTTSVLLSNETVILDALALDLLSGIFKLRSSLPTSSSSPIEIEQRWYAHQVLRSILVLEIEVHNPTSSEVTVGLTWSFNASSSSDIDFQELSPLNDTIRSMQGNINVPENGTIVEVAVVFSNIPETLTIPANTNTTFYFLSAFRSTLDAVSPLDSALSDYTSASSSPSSLLPTHTSAWASLWESGIEVSGDLDLALAINSSLYYILSSVRADWPWSLSPGGLASEAYNGHTFWDAETWMYPPLLMLHPDIAAGAVLQYRFDHMLGAEEKARSYNASYQGTMFPWESAFSGLEVCPLFAETGQLEQHISGDISMAVKNYWYMTGNLTWLEEVGFPLALGIAEFWASRVTYNETLGQYVINGVIPPDENAVNVNNSVYTNVIAELSLLFAMEAGAVLGIETPTTQWAEIAKNLRFPFDEVRNINLEYDGYTNSTIKQADVVLLAYPLMWPLDPQVRVNDLQFYSSVTETDGPAMTWSIYAIGWLDAGNQTAATENFLRSYANIHPPFNIWLETPTGGSSNFITGAGGFLQSVINGYGGIRITSASSSSTSATSASSSKKSSPPPNSGPSSALIWNPVLPSGVTQMRLRALSYLGNLLDLGFDENTMTLGLISGEAGIPLSFVVSNGTSYPITAASLTLPLGPGTIQVDTSS